MFDLKEFKIVAKKSLIAHTNRHGNYVRNIISKYKRLIFF